MVWVVSLSMLRCSAQVWELLLFTALGALGGLAGALFNHLNKRLTQWRMRHCSSKTLRALEAWAVCVVCSTVMYVVPCLWFVAASHLKRVEGVDGACEGARPHCRWRRAATSLRWRLAHPCAIAATQYTPSRRVDVDTMTAPTSTPSPRRSDAVDARRPAGAAAPPSRSYKSRGRSSRRTWSRIWCRSGAPRIAIMKWPRCFLPIVTRPSSSCSTFASRASSTKMCKLSVH